MKKKNFFTKSLTFNILIAIVVALIVACSIVSTIGYYLFKNNIKETYTSTSYKVADLVNTFYDHNKVDEFLSTNGETEEYKSLYNETKVVANSMNANVIYLIRPIKTTEGYKTYMSIINVLSDTSTLNSEWTINSVHNTSNTTYENIYKDMYEGDLERSVIFRTTNLSGADPHITTLTRVKDSSSNVVGIMCVQFTMSEYKHVIRVYSYTSFITSIVLALFVAFLAALYMRYQFVRPLNKIISETERFSKENKKLDKKLGKISRIRGISNLALAIDKLEDDMDLYIEDIKKISSEKEKMGVELNIAKSIQEASVPTIFPEREDIDIYALMTPAKEVGGDFYNFFFIDNDHLALIMADVSGKGIPAALFMMISTVLLNDTAEMISDPAKILEFANRRLCAHNSADMFVTVWLGILEISTGKIVAANAGHDDPFILRAGTEFEYTKNKHGVALGAFELAKYQNFEINLGYQDIIFLYTDGVPEATNSNQEMITLDGVKEILNEFKNDSPKDIILNVKKKIDEFVGDAPQFDDITMLCLKRCGNLNTKMLEVDAKKENLDEVNSFVMNYIEPYNVSSKILMQLELVIEEIFINIASYAYRGGDGKALIYLSLDNNVLKIEFRDKGVKYNPLERKDPNINASAEEREIGGLGVYLVKKNVDSISYKYESDSNILTLTKKIVL